jgi:hypothetical protein
MSLSLTHMWSRSNCSLKMSGEHSKLDQLWVTNDACTGICICILWPCKAVETIYTIKIVAKHSVTLIKEKTIQIKKTMSVQNENYRKHKLPTKNASLVTHSWSSFECSPLIFREQLERDHMWVRDSDMPRCVYRAAHTCIELHIQSNLL